MTTINPFVLDSDPTVEWPVTVNLPANGGKVAQFQFTGVFKVLSETEYDALLRPYIHSGEGEAPNKTWTDILEENVLLIPQLIVDWRGVQRRDGTPVPISELPSQIKGVHGRALGAAIWQAIREIRLGIDAETPSALVGNSDPSPATGSV